jgi:hypothetical protein
MSSSSRSGQNRFATAAATDDNRCGTYRALLRLVAKLRQRWSIRPWRLIAFDGDTFDKLKRLGRDRMATLEGLADKS